MKRNKRLEQIASDSQKQFENDELKQMLLAKHQKTVDERKAERRAEDKKALRSKPFAVAMASVACIVAVMVTLVCVFLQPYTPTDEDKDFATKPFPLQETTLSYINNLIRDYKINSNYATKSMVTKDHDGETELFYFVEINSSDADAEEGYMFEGTVNVSTNSYLFKEKKDMPKTVELAVGTLHYQDNTVYDGEMLYTYTFSGWIERSNRLIVVDISVTAIDESLCNVELYMNKLVVEKSPEEIAAQAPALEQVEQWQPYAARHGKKQSRFYRGLIAFLTKFC